MRRVAAIAAREFASYFRLPIGWVVMALYLALSGVVFAMGSLTPGEPASLRLSFGLSGWLLMFIAPAISMRLISEELRTGTIEPLMTAPVSDWQVATGKYAAACAFLLTMLAPTLVFVLVLELLSEPDHGPIIAGYAGLVLLGAFYLAVGTLASALSANQIVAFLGSLFFLLLLRVLTVQGAALAGPPWDRFLYPLSFDLRMVDFSRGVIDTSHIVFFVATSAWLLTLAVVAMESRRWR